MPTSQGYDAATVCNELADFVITNHFDGVDLDYEDTGAFDAGTGEQWIITCMKTLRQKLPLGQYIITSAPQAPYFTGTTTNAYKNGAWVTINQ